MRDDRCGPPEASTDHRPSEALPGNDAQHKVSLHIKRRNLRLQHAKKVFTVRGVPLLRFDQRFFPRLNYRQNYT